MNDSFEQRVRAARVSEELSRDERAHMRTLLAEYAAFKPVRSASTAQGAGWFAVLRARLPQPLIAGAGALASLLLLTGGVAYGAQSAVPGNVLYGIKVSITEPVITALTPAGEAQADWQMAIAKRRIDEAVELARAGRLSSSTEALLVAHATTAARRGAAEAELDLDTPLATSTTDATRTTSVTASTTHPLDEASVFFAHGRAKFKTHDASGASADLRAALAVTAHLVEATTSEEESDTATSTPAEEEHESDQQSNAQKEEHSLLEGGAASGAVLEILAPRHTRDAQEGGWPIREEDSDQD